ncbi:hypothetical protein F4680DRAFT_152024 [Xylaria scruposa]|nr:hypothetical protein F4680DRAFT_152024 [Xylaria scruposa]
MSVPCSHVRPHRTRAGSCLLKQRWMQDSPSKDPVSLSRWHWVCWRAASGLTCCTSFAGSGLALLVLWLAGLQLLDPRRGSRTRLCKFIPVTIAARTGIMQRLLVGQPMISAIRASGSVQASTAWCSMISILLTRCVLWIQPHGSYALLKGIFMLVFFCDRALASCRSASAFQTWFYLTCAVPGNLRLGNLMSRKLARDGANWHVHCPSIWCLPIALNLWHEPSYGGLERTSPTVHHS